MNFKHSEELSFRQRLEIIVGLFTGESLRPIFDKLSPSQLVEAHDFLWDKLVEFHYKTQSREFRRDEVTRKMVPSTEYQKLQNCDLWLDYCKGVECIWSNPVCASNKIKNNMEVMAEHIRGLLTPGQQSVTTTEEKRYAVLS